MERIGWWPTRNRPIARAWKDSSLVLEMRCLDTDERLDNSSGSSWVSAEEIRDEIHAFFGSTIASTLRLF